MLAPSRLWWRPCASCFITGILLALPQSSLPAQGVGAPKKSQYQNYWNQLKSRFQQWDLDGNKLLDKAELAKAFRGSDAKPYDDDTPDGTSASKAKKGKVKTISLALACLPRPGLAVNLTLAELLSQPKPKDKTLNPAVMQYGDFQFLALIGKDDQIAKQDYDNWCMGYAKTWTGFRSCKGKCLSHRTSWAKPKTQNKS